MKLCVTWKWHWGGLNSATAGIKIAALPFSSWWSLHFLYLLVESIFFSVIPDSLCRLCLLFACHHCRFAFLDNCCMQDSWQDGPHLCATCPFFLPHSTHMGFLPPTSSQSFWTATKEAALSYWVAFTFITFQFPAKIAVGRLLSLFPHRANSGRAHEKEGASTKYRRPVVWQGPRPAESPDSLHATAFQILVWAIPREPLV